MFNMIIYYTILFNKYYYTYLFSKGSASTIIQHHFQQTVEKTNYTTKHKSIINYTKQISLKLIITKHLSLIKFISAA